MVFRDNNRGSIIDWTVVVKPKYWSKICLEGWMRDVYTPLIKEEFARKMTLQVNKSYEGEVERSRLPSGESCVESNPPEPSSMKKLT